MEKDTHTHTLCGRLMDLLHQFVPKEEAGEKKKRITECRKNKSYIFKLCC